jgi:hypothetical protein
MTGRQCGLALLFLSLVAQPAAAATPLGITFLILPGTPPILDRARAAHPALQGQTLVLGAACESADRVGLPVILALPPEAAAVVTQHAPASPRARQYYTIPWYALHDLFVLGPVMSWILRVEGRVYPARGVPTVCEGLDRWLGGR